MKQKEYQSVTDFWGKIGCPLRLLPLLILFLVALPLIVRACTAELNESCGQAVKLYNKAAVTTDTMEQQHSLEKAIGLCNNNEILAKVFNNLANVFEKQGRLLKALDTYKKGLQHDVDLAVSWLSVGDIYLGLGDYHSAAMMYEKALHYGAKDFEVDPVLREAEEKRERTVLVYCPKNSAELSTASLSRLDDLAGALTGKVSKYAKQSVTGEIVITVTGHTCSRGSREMNQRLSMDRATVVAKRLEQLLAVQLPEKEIHFEVSGKGEDTPLVANDLESGRILNRRVQVIWKESQLDK